MFPRSWALSINIQNKSKIVLVILIWKRKIWWMVLFSTSTQLKIKIWASGAHMFMQPAKCSWTPGLDLSCSKWLNNIENSGWSIIKKLSVWVLGSAELLWPQIFPKWRIHILLTVEQWGFIRLPWMRMPSLRYFIIGVDKLTMFFAVKDYLEMTKKLKND